MEKQSKDAVKTKDVLKQLQAELRQLQTAVSGLQKPEVPADRDAAPAPRREKPEKTDWAAQYAVQHGSVGGGTPLKTGVLTFTESQLERVPDEAAATLGYALSSPQKVALLRALLVREAESAAALGETAALSTGSLYHHLHDLMHAGLVGQAGRNRYVLTEYGRRVLLIVLALAAPA